MLYIITTCTLPNHWLRGLLATIKLTMANWLISLLVFVVVAIERGRCNDSGVCGCDDNIADTQTCVDRLFMNFECALLSNGSNMYKLRKLLYPSDRTHPELAKITYQLVFTTGTSGSRHVAEDLRNCRAPLVSRPSSGNVPSCLCPGAATKLTLLYTNGVTYGWTTIGIYTLIHPAVLNLLQVQLPFAIMRLVTPHDGPFLWNGHNQLPNIRIQLTVSTDSLTCFPRDIEVDGALKTLTSFVSIYFTEYSMH